MKEPKTIKQYIKIMRILEKTSILDKKGFEKLNKNVQSSLSKLSACISNTINEIPND